MQYYVHTLSQKTVSQLTQLTCYNLDTHGLITIIFGINVTEKVGNQNVLYFIKMYFIFLPHLNSASALPGETGNLEIASFHLNSACFNKNTQNTLKYHLVTAEPPFTVKTIYWVHQTEPRKHSILLSVT